jgi:DNA-binding NarL/FixJ family response regulator
MRVLLVEDHRQLCEELQLVLHTIPDVQVIQTCATSGQALAWLGGNRDGWDLALVDLFLQEGNGFDVLRGCGGRADHQKVAVISNYTRDPAREHARQAGADAFFDKSLQMDALIAYCVARAEAWRLRTRTSGPLRGRGPSLRGIGVER